MATLPVFEGLRCTSVSMKQGMLTYGNRVHSLQVVGFKRVIKKRQIILAEDVENLGRNGDLVTVKAGYFRNYLYPKGIAKLATPEYLKELKLAAERKEREKKKLKDDAEALASELQRLSPFVVKRKRGMARLIFGTVTNQDVADLIESRTKQKIDKRNLSVPDIREIGAYTIQAKLHPEVTTEFKINVA